MPSLAEISLSFALMDRWPLTLEGLTDFIVGHVENVSVNIKSTALEHLMEQIQYQNVDIVVTELNGLGETVAQGCEMLLKLSAASPALRIIIYTRCKDSVLLQALVMQKNISLISREDSLDQVGEFIRRVAVGERVFSPSVAAYLARQESFQSGLLERLTRSENYVLSSLFEGLSVSQIAEHMCRSVKTISAHKCNAMRKLQVENDSELFSLRSHVCAFSQR